VRTALLAIGRLRPALRQVCDDYLRRLTRFGAVEEQELREGPAARPPAERVRIEGERLLARLAPEATLIVLDKGGDLWSSEDLARRLERWRVARQPLALAIGGPLGLERAVLARARHAWSLGRLTLPHELARVVVVEQWYRAWTILRGEPYHK
jgi:23S rRNA (pseudouridine1915-N3)-methyltransferase